MIFSSIKTQMVWKIEIIAAIGSQTSIFFYPTIKMDISLIYNSKDRFQNVLYYWSLVYIKQVTNQLCMVFLS